DAGRLRDRDRELRAIRRPRWPYVIDAIEDVVCQSRPPGAIGIRDEDVIHEVVSLPIADDCEPFDNHAWLVQRAHESCPLAQPHAAVRRNASSASPARIDGGLSRVMFAGELADLATQPNAILDCFAEVKAGEDSRLAVLRLRFGEAGPAADGASRDGRS